MSDPTFQIAKSKLEEHIRRLINQPIVEFQEDWNVKIESITVNMIDVSSVCNKVQHVHNVKIKIE